TDLGNGGAEGLRVHIAATDIEQILVTIPPAAIAHPFETRVGPEPVEAEEQATLQRTRVEDLPRPDRPKGVGEPHAEFRLFQDIEQSGHRPALDEGGREVQEVRGLRLLLERGDGQTAFALFGGEDLDLRVGWEGRVERGEGSVHLPAEVLDEDAAVL